MMLNYSFHENLDDSDVLMSSNSFSSPSKTTVFRENFNDMRIIAEKIRVPDSNINFYRARLNELLTKQTEQFGTSLILGRAGTGKSTVAIEFAKNYERVAWFNVESTDLEWETFSQYFISSFQNHLPDLDVKLLDKIVSENLETKVLKFLEILFFELEKASQENQFLIVLDDLHNVFDAEWFETFFKGLLSYQIPNIHILLLSRSKPPFPLWRLRSKQKLGVLEENLLLFTVGEFEEFLKKQRVSKPKMKIIHKESYGRISKILELCGIQFIHDTAG